LPEILLESAQVPNQQTLAAFVRQRIIRLRAAPIKQVKLYVRQTGEEIPAGVRNLNWQHNRCLWSYHSQVLWNLPRGNVEAIALMNRSYNLKALLLSKLPLRMVAFKSCWNLLAGAASASGIDP